MSRSLVSTSTCQVLQDPFLLSTARQQISYLIKSEASNCISSVSPNDSENGFNYD